MSDLDTLVERSLHGTAPAPADAVKVLQTPDPDVLQLVTAVSKIRRAYFGNRVKLNYLVNLKSGLCQENCNYCSQALGSRAPILKYSWLSTEDALAQATAGVEGGASRVCLVASGRGPLPRDIDRVCDITSKIRDVHPDVEVCACLGLLRPGQAQRLVSAEAYAYNHNINTAASFHHEIVQTHTYTDRVNTITQATQAGLSPCSGLIVGMGESDEQIVEALTALRELNVESLPINFLVPFDGTVMEGRWQLTSLHCLRIVALARLMHPNIEIRLAGGRELHLRTTQPLALHLANSIFLGDYLTAEGQAAAADLDMIRDNGFTIEKPVSTKTASGSTSAPIDIRERGAGTAIPPNA